MSITLTEETREKSGKMKEMKEEILDKYIRYIYIHVSAATRKSHASTVDLRYVDFFFEVSYFYHGKWVCVSRQKVLHEVSSVEWSNSQHEVERRGFYSR